MMRTRLALLLLAGCGTPAGDPPLDAGPPSAVGFGARVKDVRDPQSPKHPNVDPTKNESALVQVTGAAVLWVDTFDETNNGKSRGTIYVQDVGSQAPYSGISLYSPTFVPGDLRLAAGDVLDLNGSYQENGNIGTAKFTSGFLPQISKPVGTFRYEYRTPDPVVVDVNDLDDYAKGSQWLNMLVTVKNVALTDDLKDEGLKKATPAPTGRVTAYLTAAQSVKLTNENVQLPNLPAGTKFQSVTGIVTYFFDLHIAPRTLADLVQ